MASDKQGLNHSVLRQDVKRVPADAIGISIVIPTEGRAVVLERLLNSIQKSKWVFDGSVEIIVVDSSETGIFQVIGGICSRYQAVHMHGPRSVRAKRNQGAKGSCFPYILFLDSDCEVSPGLLTAYSEFIRGTDESSFIVGAGPTRFQGGETVFTNRIRHSSLLDPFRRPEIGGPLPWATTSNLLVSRTAFDQVGGFREDLPFRLGGDDTDLCLRLRNRGHEIIGVPDAICFHGWETWASPLSVVRRSFRWGWMQPILFAANPEYQRSKAPNLPAYFTGTSILSMIIAVTGYPAALIAPVLFLVIAVLIHGLMEAFPARDRWKAFVDDLALAMVECPFGFGEAFGGLSRKSLAGYFRRLGTDDSEMDKQFPSIVKDIWSDNIALLMTLASYALLV